MLNRDAKIFQAMTESRQIETLVIGLRAWLDNARYFLGGVRTPIESCALGDVYVSLMKADGISREKAQELFTILLDLHYGPMGN